MNTLIMLTLFCIALAALARAIYYQVVVLRRMAWPYEGETPASSTALPPKGTSMERMQAFMKGDEHRPLRRTWAAAWVWALMFFFILLTWVLVTGNSA